MTEADWSGKAASLSALRHSPKQSPQYVLYALISKVSQQRDLNVLAQLTHPEVIDHTPTFGQTLGVDSFIESFRGAFEAIPDLTVDLVDYAVRPPATIFFRLAESGTLRRPLADMPRTGCHLEWEDLGELRILDGRIREFWSVSTLQSRYESYWRQLDNARDDST